jgi:hypothetical protein
MHWTPHRPSLAAIVLVLGGPLAFGTVRGQAIAASEADAPLPVSVGIAGDEGRAAQGAEEAPPSDSDLKTFAEIYAQLQEADAKFEHDMADARTVHEARAVTDERDRASEAALTSHGWTRSKFDRVASAIDRDPALIERAIKLFEENS